MLSLLPFDAATFTWLVGLTLLGPLLLAALLARYPESGWLRGFSPLTVAPALLLAFGPHQEVVFADLVLGVRFGVDGLAAVFLLFSGLLWGGAAWFGLPYLAHDQQRSRYTRFFLIAQAGNLGLILAQDIATFYFCFALMSFASYVLVVHDGKPASQRAGRIYLALALVGEVLQFIAFSIIAMQVPDARLADVPQAVAQSPHRDMLIALLLAGLGVKAGLVPLHVWLPLAHPVAPTPASAVLSGAMIKAGLLGWLRFLPLGLVQVPTAGYVLIVLGLVGSLGGAVVGVTQRHPKSVLAYSSISQMGLMILMVGVALVDPSAARVVLTGVVLYAAHHALAKGALFLGVGMATAAPGGGKARGLVMAGCALAGLALAGAPWTSGMLAKTALKKVAALVPGVGAVVLGWLLSLGAVGTTALMARFLIRLRALQRDPAQRHEVSAVIWWPWLTVLAAMVSVSWFALPALIEPLTGKLLSWPKLGWPILVGLLGTALVVGWRRHRAPVGEITPGDVIGVVQRMAPLLQAAAGYVVRALTAARDVVHQAQIRVMDLSVKRARWLDHAEVHLAEFLSMGLVLLGLASLLFLSWR